MRYFEIIDHVDNDVVVINQDLLLDIINQDTSDDFTPYDDADSLEELIQAWECFGWDGTIINIHNEI